MSQKMPIALLASRSGRNAARILQATQAVDLPFSIGLVICNGPGACASRFSESGVAAVGINDGDFPTRGDFERRLQEILADFGNPLAVSCSFNRLLGAPFLDSYPNHVINSHPSLLPAFPGRPDGLKPVDAALRYGVKLLGATTHFIDSGMDTGPIIIQGAIPCPEAGENAAMIDKVLRLEALLKVAALCFIAEKRVTWAKGSRHVRVESADWLDAGIVLTHMQALIFPPLPRKLLPLLPLFSDGGEQ